MKNRSLFLSAFFAVFVFFVANLSPAQTVAVPDPGTNAVITGPAVTILQFLSTGSNMMATTYGIYDAGSGKAGGGIGLLYKLSDFMAAGLRLDYLDGAMWMPSGNFQLQAPFRLFNKFDTVPFVFAGMATPVSGRGSENGTLVGIFGVGNAVRIGKKWDVVYDLEKWEGADFRGLQHRFGFLYKF